MAKDSFWFKHDNNARNDEKILELRVRFGAEGYGIYWMIVETMAEDEYGFINSGAIGGLSLGYGVAIGRLSEIIGVAIQLELFHEKDGKIFSNRMLRHKKERKELSEHGKNGAKKRWPGHRGANGDPNGVAIADPIAEKKREEERRREKNKGVNFSEDGMAVLFSDGSSQELTSHQKFLIKHGELTPDRIIREEKQ